MKTPAATNWISGLIFVMASMLVSLAQTDPDGLAKPAAAVSLSQATTAQTPPGFPAMVGTKDFPAMPLPERDAGFIKRQLPKLRCSPWTGEVVKLAESGVETGVILAFIENSGTFNLGADQIVYLNDLGLSSEVINAMLHHDRELITGAKPLSITSEPEWQVPTDLIFAVVKPAADNRSPKAPTPSSRSAATVEPDRTPTVEPLPEINRPVTVTPFAATGTALLNRPTAVAQSGASRQGQPTDTKSIAYPVREPFPVELTAPIIFVNGDGRIPNTLVVLGFPRSVP